MKKLISIALVTVLLLSLAACSSGTTLSKDITLLTKFIEKQSVDTASADDLGGYVRSFGIELLKLSEDENPVISPLSAYLCLSMAAAGADGVTAEEFEKVFGGDAEALGAFAAAITEELTSGEESGTIFRIANSAWTDDEANILASYLSALVSYYNAEMYSGDLSTDDARKSINAWIKDKTEGLIPQMLNENLDKDTMLVLINTIYMKAEWRSAFLKEGTYKDTFHAVSGDVTAEFMHKTSFMPYASENGMECVVLPYKSDSIEFAAIRSTDGRSAHELLSELTADGLDSLISLADTSDYSKVMLSIPKFTVESSFDMTKQLPELGLVSAFDPDTADLSLTGTGADGYPLYISQVLQKVKIIVDEKGTEAAAATVAIETDTSSAPVEEPPIDFTLDEPFVYVIFDTTYNAPIFIGILDNPTN